jgi:DNA-binding NarL/FixJ family response regulator
LRVTSFTPEQASEALRADKTFRMLIFSIGGEPVTDNLQQLKVLRALTSNAPLVIISDRDDPHDVVAAFETDAQGFINSGTASALAFQALTFILNGGSYYPPSAVHQLHSRAEESDKPKNDPPDESNSKRNGPGTNGSGNGSGFPRRGNDVECQAGNLTARQREVLEHLRLGESNKMIARRLGMTEGTVKVHIRQMMRKCHAINRTQLALGGSLTTESPSTASVPLRERTTEQNGSTALGGSFKSKSPPPPPPLNGTAARSRARILDKH